MYKRQIESRSQDLGWDLLSILPQSELDRVDNKLLEEKYHPERGAALLKEMRGEA